MGKLTGIALIAAGVAVGAYTLSSPRNDPWPHVVITPESASTGGVKAPDVGQPAAKAARGEAPDIKSAVARQATPPAQPPSAPPDTAKTAREEPPRPAPSATPTRQQRDPHATADSPARLLAEPASQMRRQHRGPTTAVRISEAPQRVPVGGSNGSAPLDRPALTREIQRQLKRIGCYRGDASGAWTASAREAMKTLTERVNASLPVDQPDPVLLAMVQSQAPGACRPDCPQGQRKAHDGRCLPQAVAASTGVLRAPVEQAHGERTKPPPPTDRATASATDSAAQAPDVEGRMSLAGPTTGEKRRVGVPTALARPRQARTASRPRSAAVRSANARLRGRYRGTQRRSGDFSGFSSWFPFSLP
jgi:hypothetical protein